MGPLAGTVIGAQNRVGEKYDKLVSILTASYLAYSHGCLKAFEGHLAQMSVLIKGEAEPKELKHNMYFEKSQILQ